MQQQQAGDDTHPEVPLKCDPLYEATMACFPDDDGDDFEDDDGAIDCGMQSCFGSSGMNMTYFAFANECVSLAH